MNIGIIGCGTIAQTHLRVLRQMHFDKSFFFCDSDKAHAEKLSSIAGTGKVYLDSDEMLSKESLDCVHILTPLRSHALIAERALQCGCHVYIEKPVTETVMEFRRLRSLAEKHGKVLCAGYSTLGMPVILRSRDVLSSGQLGRLICVHCDFLCSWPGNLIPYGDPAHWSYSLRGGILQNMVDHPISLIVDAMDSIESHSCYFCNRNILPNNCLDLLNVTLQNNDQVGSFTLYMGNGPAQWQIHYFLEQGMIMADMGRQLVTVAKTKGSQNFIKKTLSGLEFGYSYIYGTMRNIINVARGSLQRNPGIQSMLLNFYQAIAGKESLLVHQQTAEDIIGILEKIWHDLDQSLPSHPRGAEERS